MPNAMANPDRVDLEEFLGQKSEAAFERLARRYVDMVYGTCQRLVHRPADAEDASQAVFIALTHKAASVDPERLGGWLHTAAVRAAQMANRAEAVRTRHEMEAARMREATDQPACNAEAAWDAIRPHLDAEVERLPTKLREAVIRHFFAGRSHAELAEELGIPRATAASRVQLGLERLRGRLKHHGVGLTAVALGPILAANGKLSAPAALLASLPQLGAGKAVTGASAGAGQGASDLAKGVLKMMYWEQVKLVAAVVAVVLVAGAGGALKLAAGEPAKPVALAAPSSAKQARKGPLAALPSAPGPHIAKIKALGDNQWLNLGAPAADPKWGKARGSSWGAKALIFAPDVQGAFLFGEGQHAFVKPDGHVMDDLWFYDINAHAWICLYPGTNTKTFNQRVKDKELKIDGHGRMVDSDGQPIPVHPLVHAWGYLTYDSDRKKFAFFANISGGGIHRFYLGGAPQMEEGLNLLDEQKKGTNQGFSPWFYDVASGKFERSPATGSTVITGSLNTRMAYPQFHYLPAKQQFYLVGSAGVGIYDPAKSQWREANPKGPVPLGIDGCGCYDSKRNRIYRHDGAEGLKGVYKGLMAYDIESNTWLELKPTGTAPPAGGHNEVYCEYDPRLDIVLVMMMSRTERRIFTYNPQTNSWADALTIPADGPRWSFAANICFDRELNAYFCHVAGDSEDNGVIWVYRYKRAPEKK